MRHISTHSMPLAASMLSVMCLGSFFHSWVRFSGPSRIGFSDLFLGRFLGPAARLEWDFTFHRLTAQPTRLRCSIAKRQARGRCAMLLGGSPCSLVVNLFSRTQSWQGDTNGSPGSLVHNTVFGLNQCWLVSCFFTLTCWLHLLLNECFSHSSLRFKLSVMCVTAFAMYECSGFLQDRVLEQNCVPIRARRRYRNRVANAPEVTPEVAQDRSRF
jgi:hypothetical protein